MKINIFWGRECDIEYGNKFGSIGIYILIVDNITWFENTGWANLFAIDIDKISEVMIMKLGKDVFINDEETLETINGMRELYPKIQQAKKIKHKPGYVMAMLGTYGNSIKFLRKAAMKDHDNLLEFFKIEGLKPFVEEKIWMVPILDFSTDTYKEDILIQPIVETLTQREHIFDVDCLIEEFFTFTTNDSPEEGDFDFIRIPMWDIPLTKGMSFEKLKYTRNDLLTALMPFKSHLNELSDALFPISFIPKNISQIKQLCREKLNGHITAVQESINDSLYISQLLNQSAENSTQKLYIGIASAETLINYFEKVKIVLPYVASEIKQQTARLIDLKATCVFTYIKLPLVIGESENQEQKVV